MRPGGNCSRPTDVGLRPGRNSEAFTILHFDWLGLATSATELGILPPPATPPKLLQRHMNQLLQASIQ